MLPQPYRLRRRRDFSRAYARGKSQAGPYFVLYWRKNGARQSRVGFSVSKKLGKATRRNLVKRRCRAAARELLPLIPAGHDLIFVARVAASDAAYAALKTEMERMLGLLRQRLGTGRKA